jgi:predicted transcriptional regulator
VWTATAMLRFFLESLTDQLVVMDNKQPCGLVGGYDIISNVLKNPTHDLFEDHTIDKIMHPELFFIKDSTKVIELLQTWNKSKRAFSIIQKDSSFFAVSIRTLLGIYPFLDTDLTTHDIPNKKTIYYSNDQSVREILNIMLQNKTRRLVLEGTNSYISDRIIIEKISTHLNYLYGIDDFLDMSCSIFQPAHAKTISSHISIQNLCEILYTTDHPYIMKDDQVFSPFDLVCILERNDVYAKSRMEITR